MATMNTDEEVEDKSNKDHLLKVFIVVMSIVIAAIAGRMIMAMFLLTISLSALSDVVNMALEIIGFSLALLTIIFSFRETYGYLNRTIIIKYKEVGTRQHGPGI
jgi:hypothetical protein